MKKREFPGRDEQRQIVLKSEYYLRGDEFNRNVIAPLLGLTTEGAAHLLASMSNDGLLRRRFRKAGNKQFIMYCRPLSKALRMPWRRKKNSEIGLRDDMIAGSR